MKVGTISLVLFIIMIGISGCSSSGQPVNKQLQSENETLKAQISSLENDLSNLKKDNDSLKAEIDELKFAASLLLKQAQTYFDGKEYDKAENAINTLLSKHPDSGEAEQAKQIQTKIDAAIKQEQEILQKRIASATTKMRKTVDQDTTWYTDKTSTNYINANAFYIYIGTHKDTSPWLRLRIQYAGDDWVFANRWTFKVDNETFSIYARDYEVERENDSNGVWEYYDGDLEKNGYNMVKAIISSKKTTLRYESSNQSDKRLFTRTVTQQEKQALQNVLDAYQGLGGTFVIFK